MSPIFRLPVEILCNIFKISGSLARRPESWTNFSQVSQHWRSSALSAPEIWTDIPLNYPRWAQEMLIRSKKANLTIRSYPPLRLSDLKTIETARPCLYEINRVEEIYFRDSPKSAPQLRALCIRPFHSETVFSIHEDFLCDTERLQCVELINCKISWDSLLLTGLTRFWPHSLNSTSFSEGELMLCKHYNECVR